MTDVFEDHDAVCRVRSRVELRQSAAATVESIQDVNRCARCRLKDVEHQESNGARVRAQSLRQDVKRTMTPLMRARPSGMRRPWPRYRLSCCVLRQRSPHVQWDATTNRSL